MSRTPKKRSARKRSSGKKGGAGARAAAETLAADQDRAEGAEDIGAEGVGPADEPARGEDEQAVIDQGDAGEGDGDAGEGDSDQGEEGEGEAGEGDGEAGDGLDGLDRDSDDEDWARAWVDEQASVEHAAGGDEPLGSEPFLGDELLGAEDDADELVVWDELDARAAGDALASHQADAAGEVALEDIVPADGDQGPAEPLPELDAQLVRLKSMVESLVFASDKPLPTRRLLQLTAEDDIERVELVLKVLCAEYRGRGIVLHDVAGGWQFRTAPENSEWVQQLVTGRPVRLSRAQLETLAIIAYRQPITRPEIDDIRGVDSGGTLKVLIDRTLIRVLGKKEEPGRPLLYGTTKEFLEFFNLHDLRELPTLREYHELTEDSMRVVEKMGMDLDDLPGRSEIVPGTEVAEGAEVPVEELGSAIEPDDDEALPGVDGEAALDAAALAAHDAATAVPDEDIADAEAEVPADAAEAEAEPAIGEDIEAEPAMDGEAEIEPGAEESVEAEPAMGGEAAMDESVETEPSEAFEAAPSMDEPSELDGKDVLAAADGGEPVETAAPSHGEGTDAAGAAHDPAADDDDSEDPGTDDLAEAP